MASFLGTIESVLRARRSVQRPLIGYFRLRAIVTTSVAVITSVLFIWPFLCMLGQSFNRLDV